jgi:outer membrane biosynthesis protein TonB
MATTKPKSPRTTKIAPDGKPKPAPIPPVKAPTVKQKKAASEAVPPVTLPNPTPAKVARVQANTAVAEVSRPTVTTRIATAAAKVQAGAAALGFGLPLGTAAVASTVDSNAALAAALDEDGLGDEVGTLQNFNAANGTAAERYAVALAAHDRAAAEHNKYAAEMKLALAEITAGK